MIFHQAYFGGIRTHNCIATSIKDEQLLNELISLTDKPHTLQKIEPYYSGIRLNNYFVFIKTIPVHNVERSGMVFSHCIIANIKQIPEIQNLQSIFSHLLSEPIIYEVNINQIEVDKNDLIKTQQYENNPLINKIIKDFLDDKKVVLLGYDLFESLIPDIWQIIPYNLKINFTFRLSGNPNDLSDNLPSLIYTPISSEVRWLDTDFFIVSKSSIHTKLSLAENYLINNIENDFHLFITDYNIEIHHLTDYRKIERCYSYYKKWQDTKEIQELNKALRVSTNLFPNSADGVKLKTEILELFTSEILKSSIEIIIQIRNINFSAFTNGLEKINNAMVNWLDNFYLSYQEYPNNEIAELLNIFIDENNPVWWNKNIEEFLKRTETNIDFHWQLWEYDPSFLQLTDRFIFLQEEKLLHNIHSVTNQNLLKHLTGFTAKKKWCIAHAICSAKYYSTANEAIEKHIEVIENDYESFEYLIEIIGDKEFFNFSIISDNGNLHKISGNKIVANNELLIPHQINNLNWQSIWYYSLQKTKDISFGIENPKQLIYSFFNIIISNEPYNQELASLIAETNFGNIIDYPERLKIWKSNINQNIKSKMLNKTAIALVQEIDKFDFLAIDIELKEVLLNGNFEQNILINSSLSMIKKLSYLSKCNKLHESKLISIIENYFTQFDDNSSEFLGKLIVSKSWNKAAQSVYDYKSKHYPLYKALNHCKKMLNWWDKFICSFTRNYSSNSLNSNVNSCQKEEREKIVKKFKDLIAENRFNEFLNYFDELILIAKKSKISKYEINEIENNLIMVRANIKDAEKNENLNLVGHNSLNIDKNNIRKTLLSFIDDIEKNKEFYELLNK